MNKKAQLLEAMLFAAGKPVSRAQLRRNLSLTAEELTAAVAELQEHLAGHALQLVVTEQAIELTVPLTLLPQTRSLKRLSAAATATLAIVAYGGPLPQTHIDAVRGVRSSWMLAHLLKRGLVREEVQARNEALYGPTVLLLKELGVTSVQQLPDYEVHRERVRAALSKPQST